MSVSRRKCLVADEDLKPLIAEGTVQNLTVFENYTENSCLLECRANEIYKLCQCLPYFYPEFSSPWGLNNTTCDFAQLQCLSNQTGT
jgi:hypothetical protein